MQIVHDITVRTIKEIYPHYYPNGTVNFFIEHHHEDFIAQDIEDGIVYICCDKNGEAVGTITIKSNEICRLFVLPIFQLKGYGREMLDFAEKTIFSKYVEIVLDSSLPAKAVYLKRGFTITASNCIATQNGDFLCYDVMIKNI